MQIRLLLFIISIICFNETYAQFYPYNPYNNPYANPGYVAGQQIANAIAQKNKYGRNQLRKSINKWGECNNGSLSIEHGAVATYGSNGYFCSAAVDDRISSKLKSINKDGQNIVDVNIAENGNFIIVYNNGKDWYGALPSSLKSALDDYSYGTKFKSISFNESGTYAITTSDGFKSNNATYQAFYDDNIGDYGELLSVNICGDGAVFCYSDKARYCGRIPASVESAINKFSNTANFVKFNKHGDYLICSKYGSYSYSIGDANAGGNASTVYYDYAKVKRERESRIPDTQIDFVYSQYIVLENKNTKSIEFPKGDGFLEYIVRLELSQNQIVLRLQTVDRMNADKKQTIETHYINPSNSILEVSSESIRLTYKENGEHKGFTFVPGYKALTLNDLWSSSGESLQARHFAPPTDPMRLGMIQGFNNNQNFEHTIAGETDYDGKLNKLKTLLKKYNWSKKSGY